ncbi:adenosylcobinamide-GDP ribazoletransferase [Hahella sp. CCB-MM4]|uniref:adenosylcobinamide-GDP ribazoletransferase n=1 Tax=Hahella sp. (strain CCB-MM4) TaxID=1926491 RepID=UPI000B9BF4BC|nr:adenosylcobinamide-GDP ribazoletransferase [Hahella sp. CCB-MM4]OZG74977.1 adenosylcobinamide-GDP ribazoletransferase [Hahella sp. CCB-MM4]
MTDHQTPSASESDGTNTGSQESWWRQELQWLLMALQFYTRIPARLILPYDEADLNRASRYIGLIGWIVAAVVASAYLLGAWWHGPWIAALLAVVAGILVTGAFHEDGLADSVDGFGGGYTPERILEIMKDSRIGTYGALALSVSVVAKIIFLAQMTIPQALAAIWLAHSVSRVLAISLVGDLPYVQADQRSKVKPIAKSIEPGDVGMALMFAVLPLFFVPFGAAVVVVAVSAALRYCCKVYFLKRLGGYTGDCLGAVQQLAEMAVLLILVR